MGFKETPRFNPNTAEFREQQQPDLARKPWHALFFVSAKLRYLALQSNPKFPILGQGINPSPSHVTHSRINTVAPGNIETSPSEFSSILGSTLSLLGQSAGAG